MPWAGGCFDARSPRGSGAQPGLFGAGSAACRAARVFPEPCGLGWHHAQMPLRLSGQPLIVVPYGIPKMVPFAALSDGERYLLDGAEVSLAPSGAVYAMCCRCKHLEAGWLVAFGASHEEVEQIGRIVQKALIFCGRKGHPCRYGRPASHPSLVDGPICSGSRDRLPV